MRQHQIELRRDEHLEAVRRVETRAQRATLYAGGAAILGVAAEWVGILPSGARPGIVALGVASGVGYLITHIGSLWRWATGRPRLTDDEIALALGESPAPRPARPPMWRTRIAAAFVGGYAIAVHVLGLPLERYLGDPFLGIDVVAIWGTLVIGVLCAVDARALPHDARVGSRGRVAAWLGAAASVVYFAGARPEIPRIASVWLFSGAFTLGITGIVAWGLERRSQRLRAACEQTAIPEGSR